MSFLNLLNQTCLIERSISTKDSRGNVTKSWAIVNSSTPCRIYPQSATGGGANLNQGFSGQSILNKYIGMFSNCADIKSGDRVTWGGITLFAKEVPPIFGFNAQHHIEVILDIQET